MEELVEHLDEIVDRLEIIKIIIIDVDAHAEIEARVASVHDLEVTEL